MPEDPLAGYIPSPEIGSWFGGGDLDGLADVVEDPIRSEFGVDGEDSTKNERWVRVAVDAYRALIGDDTAERPGWLDEVTTVSEMARHCQVSKTEVREALDTARSANLCTDLAATAEAMVELGTTAMAAAAPLAEFGSLPPTDRLLLLNGTDLIPPGWDASTDSLGIACVQHAPEEICFHSASGMPLAGTVATSSQTVDVVRYRRMSTPVGSFTSPVWRYYLDGTNPDEAWCNWLTVERPETVVVVERDPVRGIPARCRWDGSWREVVEVRWDRRPPRPLGTNVCAPVLDMRTETRVTIQFGDGDLEMVEFLELGAVRIDNEAGSRILIVRDPSPGVLCFPRRDVSRLGTTWQGQVAECCAALWRWPV